MYAPQPLPPPYLPMPLPSYTRAGGGAAFAVFILIVVGSALFAYTQGYLDAFIGPQPLKAIQTVSVANEKAKVNALLAKNGLGTVDETLAGEGLAPKGFPEGVEMVDIANEGLGCLVPIVGDQCHEGYTAVRKPCSEGYCCQLTRSEKVNAFEELTGLPAAVGANIAFEVLYSGVMSSVMPRVGKLMMELMIKLLHKLALKVTAEILVKMTALMAKISAGPVGWVMAAAGMINTLIDVYDPRGYSQFGSNVCFKAMRDQIEHSFVTAMRANMPGPPFVFPWIEVLDDKVKTDDGETTTVGIHACMLEIVNSITWLAENNLEEFTKILKAGEAGAIRLSNGNTCSGTADGCMSHTTEGACNADASEECIWAGDGVCASNNFVQAMMRAVPLRVRDQHFFKAVESISSKSAKLIKVFSRKKHTWFRGMPELPYAITLTEEGRDRANKRRKTVDAPLAVITKHYRDVDKGTWKYTDRYIDAEGVSDLEVSKEAMMVGMAATGTYVPYKIAEHYGAVDPLPDKSTPFKSVEDIPRMKDKTIPEPLCLITLGELLRAICEDVKNGGIEDLGPILAKKFNLPVDEEDPDLPRENLHPYKHGVRFDMHTFKCNYTKDFCERVGMEPFTNEFGESDCKLHAAQGWAEMVFGTTLTREVIGTAKSFAESVDALFNPELVNSKKIGEACKAYTECIGHKDRAQGKLVSCCPKTKEDGEAIRDHMLVGGSMAFHTGGASLAVAGATQSRVPRTCQVMDWDTTGVPTPWCKWDAANPKIGTPIQDGELCAVGTTCARCASGKSEFWYSKGFTACGIEPGWEDGTRCGPGTTCKKCKNGSAAWDDGAHRCGPRVAGTSQAVGEACSENRHCIAHSSQKSGEKTGCCKGACTVVEAGSPGVFWCPGDRTSSVEEGGACERMQACLGHTSATRPTGCCPSQWANKSDKVCVAMVKDGALNYCPNDPAVTKTFDDGAICLKGTTCRKCKNAATYWWSKSHDACGPEHKTPDGTKCLAGSTCKGCQNPHTHWWSTGHTTCGVEPKMVDGTKCLLGSTCNACQRKATHWHTIAHTACGTETGDMADGTRCALGTSCNLCRNKATHWWGQGYDACGVEPKTADGTQCLLSTSCKACQTPATYWHTKLHHACGSEPKWVDGTKCLPGTSCTSCQRTATYWQSKAHHACGVDPAGDVVGDFIEDEAENVSDFFENVGKGNIVDNTVNGANDAFNAIGDAFRGSDNGATDVDFNGNISDLIKTEFNGHMKEGDFGEYKGDCRTSTDYKRYVHKKMCINDCRNDAKCVGYSITDNAGHNSGVCTTKSYCDGFEVPSSNWRYHPKIFDYPQVRGGGRHRGCRSGTYKTDLGTYNLGEHYNDDEFKKECESRCSRDSRCKGFFLKEYRRRGQSDKNSCVFASKMCSNGDSDRHVHNDDTYYGYTKANP